MVINIIFTLYFVKINLLLFHNHVNSTLIVIFTNINLNYILIAYLLVSTLLFFRNIDYNKYILLIFLFKLNFLLKDVIALHNTLFIYHPLILYTTIVIFFFVIKKKTITIVLFGMWFSFILGGYWSSQEFNWGGWWNWDALELGILFILVFLSSLIHFKKNYLWFFYINCYLVFVILIYWGLNKLGITISIHSFVKNNSVYKYFIILLGTYIIIGSPNIFNIVSLVYTLYISNIFLSIFFWKILMLCTSIWGINIFFFKKKTTYSFHFLINLILYQLSLINFNNTVLYKNKRNNLDIINISLDFSLIKLILVQKNKINCNLLKKDFFFFKFKNNNHITSNWSFFLKNIFSDSEWMLLF